jgi:hypothetical protein
MVHLPEPGQDRSDAGTPCFGVSGLQSNSKNWEHPNFGRWTAVGNSCRRPYGQVLTLEDLPVRLSTPMRCVFSRYGTMCDRLIACIEQDDVVGTIIEESVRVDPRRLLSLELACRKLQDLGNALLHLAFLSDECCPLYFAAVNEIRFLTRNVP